MFAASLTPVPKYIRSDPEFPIGAAGNMFGDPGGTALRWLYIWRRGSPSWKARKELPERYSVPDSI
jgi:hypothetical protein